MNRFEKVLDDVWISKDEKWIIQVHEGGIRVIKNENGRGILIQHDYVQLPLYVEEFIDRHN